MQVLVKNGTRYEGIFHGAATENGSAVAICLKKARSLSSTATFDNEMDMITIEAEDFVSILATGVDLDLAFGVRPVDRDGTLVESPGSRG